MPWGPRGDALGNSNQFIPFGNGRDAIVFLDKRWRLGKSADVPIPTLAESVGRANCKPPRRIGIGPKRPSAARLEELFRGQKTAAQPFSPTVTSTALAASASDSMLRLARTHHEDGWKPSGPQRPANLPDTRERILFSVGGSAFFSDPMPHELYVGRGNFGTAVNNSGVF
eukprot:TRINITY_DN22350_c0_g1_i2.p1 TRINITY_DN22350_c0_g1~~TRINITY_DN22350_c0_g1_i2.p1  ORF type:complete len:170 (-),score=12.85 TRINITY_DN22350_c0_g1_i2:436-945(-)